MMASRRPGEDVWVLLSGVIASICAGVAVWTILFGSSSSSGGPAAKRETSPILAPIKVPGWFWIVALIFLGLLLIAVFWYGYRAYRWRQEEYEATKRAQEREAAAFESAVERLKDQMALPSLINLNRLMLDNYHGIATNQAESSFTSSRRAMWCGFIWLLMCFSAAVFLPSAARAQLLLGSLALTGGALSAFLSRTYIHVYERSLQQLNQYFDQPLLNSYLLSAERIIGEMDTSNRDQAYQAVLERLLQSSSRVSVVNGQTANKRSINPRRSRRSKPTGAANGEVSQEATHEVDSAAN
jgi:uncharacterized SAM-binding protein YcdF (DUF218 family)